LTSLRSPSSEMTSGNKQHRRDSNVTSDDVDETRSEGTANSKISSSSSVSSQKISRKIRQAVLNESKGISKGLKKFKYVFILSILLVCGVSIGIYVASSSLISTFLSNVELIRLGGLRRYDVSQIGQDFLHLSLIKQGLIDSSRETFYRNRIAVTLDDIESTETVLYSEMSSFPTDHYELYTSPSIQVKELDQFGNEGQRLVTLWTATNTLKLHASRLLSKLSRQSIAFDPSFHWILTNGPDPLFQAYDLSTFLFQEMTVNQVQSMGTWSLALMCAAIALMLIVIVTVVRPTVYDVEDSKSQVMLIFLDIPPNTVLRAKTLCERRAATFRQEVEGDEVEQNLDNTEEASVVRNEKLEQQHTTIQKKRARKKSLLFLFFVFIQKPHTKPT